MHAIRGEKDVTRSMLLRIDRTIGNVAAVGRGGERKMRSGRESKLVCLLAPCHPIGRRPDVAELRERVGQHLVGYIPLQAAANDVNAPSEERPAVHKSPASPRRIDKQLLP